jgi:energy-coupling factor transporter ATP-binding protein EcfA2
VPLLAKKYKKKTTSQPSPNIDISHIQQQLRQRCYQLLQQQKKLTTNQIMSRDGLEFGINELFVGLGLVETRKPSKHQDILSSQQGSEFYTPTNTTISQEFEHQQFLNEVICDRQTPKSKGQRIAIIGEPGAGKTTLLQKIGEVLQQHQTVAIWISLNKIGNKPLNDYLLEDWLPDAAEALRNEASEEWKIALEEFLKTNEVCLLLDGVDEITVRSPLQHLSQQLQAGWVNSVRVILTCRVNLWENCPVEEFDVYRTLNFDYPAQVEQFIDQFFIKSEKSQDSANQLKIELKADSKARIQDLVKNPLRLSLLCYAWERGERQLPETKAELYQWFVENFYKLREYKHPGLKVSPPKQKQLNLALGELAKAALESDEFRFLLPQRFIESYLGHPDDENSLFWLAKQVGWLNCVGRMAMRPLENAYAFFHPTFQEYFAALVIDDWDFFLPRNHVNKPIPGKRYRIFESQWKEVMLFWFGLSKILIEKRINLEQEITITEKRIELEQKNIFIQALTDFKDGCTDFYNFRAYCLAAASLPEMKNCHYSDEIIQQLIEWCFGIIDPQTQERKRYLEPIRENAKTALTQTDNSKVIAYLTNNFPMNPAEGYSHDEGDTIAWILGKTGFGNSDAIQTLNKLEASNNFLIRWKASDSINKITSNHKHSKKYLEKSDSKTYIKDKPIPGNLINNLIKKLRFNLHYENRNKIYSLDYLGSSLDEILNHIMCLDKVETLIQLMAQRLSVCILADGKQKSNEISSILNFLSEYDTIWQGLLTGKIFFTAQKKLDELAKDRSAFIKQLNTLVYTIEDEHFLKFLAYFFREYTINNLDAIKALIYLMKNQDSALVLSEATESLINNIRGDFFKKVVKELKSNLADEMQEINPLRFKYSYEIIWHCAQQMSYPEFYNAWHHQPPQTHPKLPDNCLN